MHETIKLIETRLITEDQREALESANIDLIDLASAFGPLPKHLKHVALILEMFEDWNTKLGIPIFKIVPFI